MKADFGKLMVRLGFEGDLVAFDIRKELGNRIRMSTNDIGFDEVARKIYFSEGEIEIDDPWVQPILDVLGKHFIVPVQEAAKEMFERKEV